MQRRFGRLFRRARVRDAASSRALHESHRQSTLTAPRPHWTVRGSRGEYDTVIEAPPASLRRGKRHARQLLVGIRVSPNNSSQSLFNLFSSLLVGNELVALKNICITSLKTLATLSLLPPQSLSLFLSTLTSILLGSERDAGLRYVHMTVMQICNGYT